VVLPVLFSIPHPNSLGLPEGKAPVQVYPELITEEEFKINSRIPNVYCLNDTDRDPASRLAAFIEGTFAGRLRTKGKTIVFIVNTFVDLLEVTMLESSELSRRW
jgi:hypothetical protein